MSPKVLLSAAELELLPDDDSGQIELDEGEVITMARAGEEHGNVEVELLSRVHQFVKKMIWAPYTAVIPASD